MKLVDLVGQRFGRLVALHRGENDLTGRVQWLCACDCGAEKLAKSHYLRMEWTKSCGCLTSERVTAMNYRHGGKYTPEYNAWGEAKQRCTNPRHQAWKNYGARGITMCSEWLGSFEAFRSHIGPRPSQHHELDRIDNNRGYEPGNVRWVTRSVQQQNRRERVRRANGTYTSETAT